MQTFKKSVYKTSWEGPFKSIEVEYITPDFSKLTPEVMGDWGPNFHFKLDPNDPFIVNYNFKEEDEQRTYELDQVVLESPFHHLDREQYPLKMNLHDEENGLISELFFCSKGEIQKAEISNAGVNIQGTQQLSQFNEV